MNKGGKMESEKDKQELADFQLSYILYGKERQQKIMQNLKEKMEW